MFHLKGKSFIRLPRRMLFHYLGIVLACISYFGTNAQEITVYYDGSYVDNCSNSTCEAFTLDQFLNSIDYRTSTFAGIDSNSFFNALSCRDVFFLPETEAGDFASDLEPDAKQVIRDFVQTGGLMFVMGSDGFNPSSSNSAQNINAIFDYSIANNLFTSSGYSYLNSSADVDFIEQLPDSVRNFTTTNFITDLPSNAEILYRSADGDKSVVDIPYGDGHIVFLGWSFFNAGPIGSQGPNNWSVLIDELISSLYSPEFYPSCFFCDETAPVLKQGATRNYTGYYNSDGIYMVDEQMIKSRYEDNCQDFDVEILGSAQLFCENGRDQEVSVVLSDRMGNTREDLLSFSINDTIAPRFSSFPNDVTVECNYDLEPTDRDTLVYMDRVDMELDLDSLQIIEIPLSGWRFPTGAIVERTEVFFQGQFEDVADLWLRARAVPGNSSLLYNGSCDGPSRLDIWFSPEGDMLDCNELNSRSYYRSVNRDLDGLRGSAVDSFVLDVLNLGELSGRIDRLGLRFIFRSDLSFPEVAESCGYDLSYTDEDNRDGCPIGSVLRRFRVVDDYGNSEEGVQIIRVDDTRPVDIQFPEDYFIACQKGKDLSEALHPDSLPAQYSYPIVNDACQEYVVRYSDQLTENCGIHDQRFVRTWNVFSECDPDTNYVHRQELRILDTIPPQIESLPPYQVAVDDETCLAGNNFFYPSADDLVVIDCDADPSVEMRVIDSNGVQFNPMELGVGNYFVEISATDECGNTGIELVPVEFIDLVPPEIVCKTGPTIRIQLDINGEAEICGRDLIDRVNTVENCGMAGYEVNFTQSFNSSLECLDVNCADLGLHTLYVRGEDLSGNQDVCSTDVRIIDQQAPSILCTDVVIPCDVPFDRFNYPPPLAADNCGSVDSFDCTPFEFVGGFCDSTYVRICTAIDTSGNRSAPCKQFLRREDTSAFVIQWPEAVVELNCNADTSPDVTGRPEVISSCTPFEIQYQDNRSTLCGSPDLYKIEREWFVVNQCNQDLESFIQEILVTDLDPPVFTNPSQPVVEFSIPDFSCDMVVNLEAEAIDDCSGLITYSNSINGSGSLLSTRFDRGEHEVTFYATDLCGNTDSINVIISVTENKNPFIDCKENQDFYLNEVEFVDIYPSMMIDTVFDLCTDRDGLEFFISKVLDNGQDIGRQPFIRYRCSDLGINKIRLFARDKDRNIGSCDVNVQIIDTFSNCPNGNFFDIAGSIFSTLRDPIGGAVALLDSSRYQGRDIGLNGQYLFRRLPADSCYEVSIQKDSSALNGITAMDLALIRRHILNLGFLQGPHQIIAADVNGNGDISTTDIAILRSLILELTDEFNQVPSWKFIPESYTFPDPQNPFLQPIPYSDTICLLNKSELFVNFVGLKMGDVNGNANLSRSHRQSRASALQLNAKVRSKEDNEYLIEMYPNQDWLAGQVFIKFDELSVVNLSIDDFNGPTEYLHSGENFIHFLYDAGLSRSQRPLLRIQVKLRPGRTLEDVFALVESKQNLAAVDWDEERNVALRWVYTGLEDGHCFSVVPTLWSNRVLVSNSCSSTFTYQVFDLFGRLMTEGRSNDYRMELGQKEWSSGIYYIKLRDASGHIDIFKTIKSQ